MADISEISGYIAKKAVAEIKNKSVFLNEIDSESYKNEFNTKVNGYKVGQTVSLNKPALVKVIDGVAVGGDITGQFDEVEEELIQVTVNSNPIVATSITDKDAIFALAKPSNEAAWTKRVLKPVVNGLDSQAELDGVNAYVNSADNAIVVEAGFTGALKDEFKKMNARLAATRAPVEDRKAIVNTTVQNILSGEVEEFFNPSTDIKTAYKKAKIGMYGGLDFTTSELANIIRTNGCGGATLTLASNYVEGSETIDLVDAGDVVVGDKIEFDFLAVDQQSKSKSLYKAQRVVKAVDDGNDTITISPLFFEGSQRQNVDAVSLLSGATVTGVGTAGKDYLVVPVFQKMGFASCPIKLPDLGANDKINASTEMAGVSLRIFTSDDINTANSKQRAECMAAYFAPRSEWCGVIEIDVDYL